MTEQAFALREEEFRALTSICTGENSYFSECQDQPYTFNHPRRGRWVYARGAGHLFIAVRADNSEFAESPKDVARHLALKKNPDFVTTAGELRLWASGLKERVLSEDCELCGGSGTITDEDIWEAARADVFDDYHLDSNWREVETMYMRGQLDREIRDRAEAYGGFHKRPRRISEDEVACNRTRRACTNCKGAKQITFSVEYARFHRTIFNPGLLQKALAMPFIGDADRVTIHAPGCLRPRIRDVQRRLYITCERWVISFKPYEYSAYGGTLRPKIPVEEIPDFAAFLHERAAHPSPPSEEEIKQALARARRDIKILFHFEAKGFERPSMREARARVSEFQKEFDSAEACASLMLFYVETGIEFTTSFGDVDARFYGNLESMYERALKLITEERLAKAFEERCRSLARSCSQLGWGIYETLCALFEKYFKSGADERLDRIYAEIEELTKRSAPESNQEPQPPGAQGTLFEL